MPVVFSTLRTLRSSRRTRLSNSFHWSSAMPVRRMTSRPAPSRLRRTLRIDGRSSRTGSRASRATFPISFSAAATSTQASWIRREIEGDLLLGQVERLHRRQELVLRLRTTASSSSVRLRLLLALVRASRRSSSLTSTVPGPPPWRRTATCCPWSWRAWASCRSSSALFTRSSSSAMRSSMNCTPTAEVSANRLTVNSPSSMRFAISISPSRDSSETEPILRR